MTLRETAMREHPNFPWLDAADPAGVERLMRALGFIDPDESIVQCDIAGPGNMNLTLRIRTKRREFVLKQARPWVEKFDHIPAPWDRAANEIAFYRAISAFPAVRARMPKLLGADEASRTLLLEFLEGDGDFGDLYAGEPDDAEPPSSKLCESDLYEAADFLANLHDVSRKETADIITNDRMRALNFEHIFEIPLSDELDVDLESLAPGLSDTAQSLRQDARYRAIVAETGRAYLSPGPCLLHGDFFPGSWLRGRKGLRVIDPEFCFHGAPEFDVGCAIAHFALARQSLVVPRFFSARYRDAAPEIELQDEWIARFAGVEVMRRLIGVAQLPIPIESGARTSDASPPFRSALLERSRRTVLSGDFEQLWAAR